MKRNNEIDYLAQRDGDTCGICKQSLRSELAAHKTFIWQSKLGTKNTVKRKHIDLSIDHIVPKHRFKWNANVKHIGNMPANKQLAHRHCNRKKGNKCGYKDWLKLAITLFR